MRTRSLPGTESLRRWDSRLRFFVQYLQNRLLLKPSPFRGIGSDEPSYDSDDRLWQDVLRRRIFETERVSLRRFVISDWVPRAPGVWCTEEAKRARESAEGFVLERKDGSLVFDPWGKTQMVRSGVGCLRLAIKSIDVQELKFLCATAAGVAHQGFVIALTPRIYHRLAPSVERAGGAICDVVGTVRYWGTGGALPLYEQTEIPRTYLLVQDIEVKARLEPGMLDVTAAVMFRGKVEGRKGLYFTYSHFDPAVEKSILGCVNWIRDRYVGRRYSGEVLTDFDEVIPHFPGAVFPVKTLMDPNLTVKYISHRVVDKFDIHDSADLKIFVQNMVVGGNITSHTTIIGDGNVIGNNNRVVTSINKKLMKKDLRELGEAFALLRGEILQIENLPEKVKNHAVRAIEDAEDEVADTKPNLKKVEESLRRVKETMKDAGEIYDSAMTWGKRLYEVGKVLLKLFPAAKWIITLLGQ